VLNDSRRVAGVTVFWHRGKALEILFIPECFIFLCACAFFIRPTCCCSSQEQREQEAIKQRELQEYLAQHNRLAPNAGANNAGGNPMTKNKNLQSSMDPQYPPRHPQASKFAPDNDRDGGRNGRGGAGYDSEDEPPGRQQGQGRRGVPSMQLPGAGGNKANRRGADYSEEEDYPEPRRGGDQGRGGRGAGRDQGRGAGGQGRGRSAQYDSETDDRSYRSDDNNYSDGSGDSGGGGRGRRGGVGGRGGGEPRATLPIPRLHPWYMK
jgi:hypothetical protein